MIQDQPVKIAVYRGIVPKAILEERAHLAFRAEAAAEAGKKHLMNMVATSGLLDKHVDATERDEGAHDFVVSMLEDMGLLDQDKLERALEYLLSMPAVLEEPKAGDEEE